MAYNDNYPNGYKSGYSSADDPERRNYSPDAVAAQQRNAMAESQDRERRMSEYNAGLAREQARYAKEQSERSRNEWQKIEREREARRHISQRREAINIIVRQKRDAYNKKSWFVKAIATLRGKSFNKMQRQIIAEAEKKVDRMNPDQIERFIEAQLEKEGRQR